MKIFKFIFLILGVCLLLVSGTIIGIGVSIMDSTNNANAEIENNPKELIELLNNYAVDSMTNTKVDEKVSFLLNEYKTNYILSTVKNSVVKNLNNDNIGIKSVYSIFKDDGTVRFEAPVFLFGFNSVVRGDIDLTLDEEGTFSLLIKSISLGKISSQNSILKNSIQKNVNFEGVEKELSEKGIDIDFKLENAELTISISKEQMMRTVDSVIKEGETADLVDTVIDVMIGNKNFFDLKFNDDDALGAVLFLHDLAYTEVPMYDLESGIVNLSTVKEMVKTLFLEGTVTYKNVSDVFDFLVRGYAPLKEKQKDVIDGLSFASVLIPEPKLYPGIVKRTSNNMATIFFEAAEANMANISSIVLDGYYDLRIPEESFNELFNSLDFVGTSFAFINDSGEAASISVASLYTEISDNKLDIYLLLDVNGKYIYAKVASTVKENEGTLLTLGINKLSLGSKDLDEKVNTSILYYLAKVLQETNYISVNPENQTISLDFSSYIKGEFFELLAQASLNKISIFTTSENGPAVIVRVSPDA